MIYVYVLCSQKDGQLYTGCTRDLRTRLALHNAGKVLSTANRRPLDLIYYEACLDERDAFRREKYLKTTYGKRYVKKRCLGYFTSLPSAMQ
jgi:putative endonuclease